MARPDFRSTAARRLAEERELSPAIISLLAPEGTERPVGIRNIPLDRIDAQPRPAADDTSTRRRWTSWPLPSPSTACSSRSSSGRSAANCSATSSSPASAAGAPPARPACKEIPALIEQIDDETALEIGIIENLQREDLSPLEEALMYERMTHEHGYSVRKLAQKLGKDKGYIENRLRLAGAPTEIKQLVSLRKDTLSHAYELLKVEDPKKRRRLAEQVASGELSLVKLREKIEGRPRVVREPAVEDRRR